MAFDPVKIPQNVQVEDRIIGPVTLRHLVIIGVGAGLSYLIWVFVTASGAPGLIVTILCWSPTGIAFAFAFLKLNDMSLFRFLLLMIEQSQKPNVRPWAQHSGISINIITKQHKKTGETNQERVIRETSRLAELANELEKENKEIALQGAQEDQAEASVGQKTNLPVDRTRVEADELDADRSLDGISHIPAKNISSPNTTHANG